jgi:hypothetical protein
MGLFGSTRFTAWALEQVKTRLPDCGMAPNIALHGLQPSPGARDVIR